MVWKQGDDALENGKKTGANVLEILEYTELAISWTPKAMKKAESKMSMRW